jgi:signal transduction histidine kinase/CheY-like chemotaxis protein
MDDGHTRPTLHSVAQPSASASAHHAHVVQFYEGESFLVDAVSQYIAPALAAEGVGIVIATAQHRTAVAESLRMRGVDLAAVVDQGRYVALDAGETLARCTVRGWPDETRFNAVIGGAIARATPTGRPLRVRAFGEMVSLLWKEGKGDAAIRMEQLWNALATKVPFSLLCAYPMADFHREAHGESFGAICDAHTRVVPAESYTALTGEEEQLRVITDLQQKARALEGEVAERQKVEEELNARLAELADVDRRKDEFLAMLGHELRNPLSAVRNALITARLDPVRRDRALDIAGRQADQLARLVDDLLDVARITRGRIRLHTRRVRLNAIVEHALETTRQLVQERAHDLSVNLPACDVWVDGDATRLEQVVVNLVSNAAKYTERGGRIEVSVEHWGREVVLRVRDDGIGIPAETLPHVFELFSQADRTLDRAQGGLGIGLTVVRRLVELHHGRVEAHSDGAGTGAEFIVTLPIAIESADESTPAAAATSEQIRAQILLVEDNEDAADSLMMLLEFHGHYVDVVHDGVTALDLAQAKQPDVILIDIGLPGMDGHEVARRIRADPKLKHVMLVALTGYGLDDDRQRTKKAGFDHHLVKPVEFEKLQAIITDLGKPRSVKPLTVH